ncbi:hemerythrin domain-containing protein [Nonomuraea sp. NPDC046802]|uniref:hemerythrin domain-containing protein n=1 Tax=Nonomuraea sp. NPDC046802 TaxID=3154919 RepID=UPI0033DA3FF7
MKLTVRAECPYLMRKPNMPAPVGYGGPEGGKDMTLDVITMIKTDHREVESLFKRLGKDMENRPALLAELAAKFVAHSRAEEDLVYPEIVKAAPKEKGQVHEGSEEHHEAERMLLRLLDAEPDAPDFDTLLKDLVKAVGHHVEEEEKEILPAFAKAVPRQRLEQLGRAFSERKAREIMHGIPTGTQRTSEPQRKRAGRTRQDISALSKEELYHRAQEADIPGRSRMSKKQLTDALRRNGTP